MSRLARAVRRFRQSEDGSMVLEGVIVLPLLVWAYVGCFVFFDGFHAQSINAKVAYTLGDVVSRETGVTPEIMDSLYALQAELTDTDEPRRLRVTQVQYLAEEDRYVVSWSRARGGAAELTTATLADLRARLPLLADGRKVVLVETWVDYVPAFDAGIDPFTFHDLVVTAPRTTASQVCWNSVNDNGTPDTAIC